MKKVSTEIKKVFMSTPTKIIYGLEDIVVFKFPDISDKLEKNTFLLLHRELRPRLSAELNSLDDPITMQLQIPH